MFDAEAGWATLPALLSERHAAAITARCEQALASLGPDADVGDKPFGGTRRMANLTARAPDVVALVSSSSRLTELVVDVLGPDAQLAETAYRCPQPGFGGQRFHADDVPLTRIGPTAGLTLIIALVAFTGDNGATRVIPGSYRRVDLQRDSGRLEDHRDAITLTGPPGTGFVFSRNLLHTGSVNRSTSPRPALQLSWTQVAV